MALFDRILGRRKVNARTGYPSNMRTQTPQIPAAAITRVIPEGQVHTPWTGGPGRGAMKGRTGHGVRVFQGAALGEWDKPDLSPENMRKWAYLGDEFGREFVYHNQPFHVHSTNIKYFQYWIDSQELYVEFLSGHGGTYSDVTEQEAIECTQVASKGSWVIDVLIGRANLTGHACWWDHGNHTIKPYRRGYKPAALALIPETAIRVLGPGEPTEPELEIPEASAVLSTDLEAFRIQERQHARPGMLPVAQPGPGIPVVRRVV